jgi:HTH-type transcriptional regulator/antitoxin HigA
MSQKEFAQRMDMTEKHISRLINGKVELTHETALRLESVLGIPATFWNNMEALYREQEARALDELTFEHDEDIASKIPYSECVKLNWLQPTRSKKEKVHNLRKFFEVANLGVIEKMRTFGIAYRTAGASSKSDYAKAIWAQRARMEARTIQTDPISISLLKESLPQIRAMTTLDPEIFCVKLEALLARCGIALVFLPHISGSFIHGATFVDGTRIVLGLTVRGKYADKFWFGLFHELGHIICGHITRSSRADDDNETDADSFAQNALIPREQYDIFVKRKDFTKPEILYFSSLVGIAPGIVVGRLQKEKHIDYTWFHELKTKYEYSKS